MCRSDGSVFVDAEASDLLGRRRRLPRRESPSRVGRVVGFVRERPRGPHCQRSPRRLLRAGSGSVPSPVGPSRECCCFVRAEAFGCRFGAGELCPPDGRAATGRADRNACLLASIEPRRQRAVLGWNGSAGPGGVRAVTWMMNVRRRFATACDARYPLAQTRVTNIRVSAVGPWASAAVTIYRAARSSRGDAFVRNLYWDLLLMSVAALSRGSVEPDPWALEPRGCASGASVRSTA